MRTIPAKPLALLLLALFVGTGTASAVTYTVNSSADGVLAGDDDLQDGICAASAAFGGLCTLRAAIEQSNEIAGPDIIEFDGDRTIDIIQLSIEIEDGLTIRGTSSVLRGPSTGVTLQSSSLTGMLRVLSGAYSVIFEDLRFSNSGGQALTIGAVTSMTIRRCLFEGNHLTSGSASGGAVTIGADGVVEDSEFRNNSTSATNGGAVHIGTNAIVTLRNVVIDGNSAGGTGDGGGISVQSGTVTFEDVEVTNNTAGGDGGGIHAQAPIQGVGLRVLGNTAPTGDGGGIWSNYNVGGNSDDALDLEAVEIFDNEAGGNGGGLYLGTQGGLHPVRLARAAIWQNDATTGGGIYSLAAGALVVLANTTVADNTAGNTGGVWAGLGLTLLHGTVWDNQGAQIFDGDTGNASVELGNSIVGFERLDGLGCVKNNFQDPPVQLGPNLSSDATCGAATVEDPEMAPAMSGDLGFVPVWTFSGSSPAVDAGNATLCTDAPVSSEDANGPNRPLGLGCDLGAWEGGALIFSDGFEGGDASLWS